MARSLSLSIIEAGFWFFVCAIRIMRSGKIMLIELMIIRVNVSVSIFYEFFF